MFSIGLVLGAGGPLGDPWHAGVLGRLQETTGWDARSADLAVGTSAGSITAVTLCAGVSAVDRALHFTGGPISPEAEAIYARIKTPYTEPETGRDWRPLSPKMALKAAWPPWRPDPIRLAVANLPRGTRSGASLAARMDELQPDGWPDDPIWLVAVRTGDGRRVVFGRDDVRGTVGQAVQASSAVPGFYVPARIGDREYVDGGIHSPTNADLVATLGFDLVIVSSSMSAVEGNRSWITDPTRAWASTKLDGEVARIRSTGTVVLVVEPDGDTLPRLDKSAPDASGLRDLLDRAASDR